MGAIEKMKDVAEEVAGKTREIMGKATGNEVMEAEGMAEQIDAKAKLRAEHEKDAHKGRS